MAGELYFDATLDDNVAPAPVSECVFIYLSMTAAAASANFICMAIGSGGAGNTGMAAHPRPRAHALCVVCKETDTTRHSECVHYAISVRSTVHGAETPETECEWWRRY